MYWLARSDFIRPFAGLCSDVIAIIALLCVIAIPQLTASVKSIAALVQEKWPDWVGLLQRYGIDTEKLSAHFAALDWKSILQSISSEMNTVISSVANVAGSTVSAIADVAISLVITFYVLIGWRELSSQSKRALYAYCKESVADRICHISKLAHDTYAKFLSGQCVEVMILGTLIFSFAFCCRDSICGANSRFNCRLCIRSLYWRISLLRFRHFIYFIGGSEQGAPMLYRLSGNSVC